MNGTFVDGTDSSWIQIVNINKRALEGCKCLKKIYDSQTAFQCSPFKLSRVTRTSNKSVACFEISVGHEVVQITVNIGSKMGCQIKRSAVYIIDTECCSN